MGRARSVAHFALSRRRRSAISGFAVVLSATLLLGLHAARGDILSDVMTGASVVDPNGEAKTLEKSEVQIDSGVEVAQSGSGATTDPSTGSPNSTGAARGNAVMRRPFVPRKLESIRRWVTSLNLWQEQETLTRNSDNHGSAVLSSLLVLGLGRQWRWQRTNWGWITELQGLIGQSESESHDASVVYFHNQDLTYGFLAAAGATYVIERPRLLCSASLATIFRQVSYVEPAGYSFGGSQSRAIPYVRLELSWPLAARMDLVQDLGIPVNGDGAIWTLGLHF